MLKGLPLYIPMVFILTTLITFLFFLAAVKKHNSNKTVGLVASILLTWLALHAVLGYKGFYTITNTFPPRFALMVIPAFFFIILLFLVPSGKRFIDSLSLRVLTSLHVVRILVEVTLFWLFLEKYVPKLMTFEGRNFDIISGITAPFIAYFGFIKHKLSRTFLIAWNVVCLLLLFNIVVSAVLSAPFTFQRFAFDQPNIALLYFPFVWLPCFIVPIVLLSHLVTIRRLSKKESHN